MLILLRHGESTANAEGRLLGRMEAPLTDWGKTQAEALRPSAAGARSLISSPLGRARETAMALGTDLAVETDERWVEVDYGSFDGQPLSNVPHDVWATWRSDPMFRPPGGESLVQVEDRVRSACEDLFAREGDGARGELPVVVVSHVTPIKVATCWALGVGVEASWRLYLATASVTRISWGRGGPILDRFNGTPWDDRR